MDYKVDLSVVIPLFNEEEAVLMLHRRLKEELQGLGLNYEIIFVDDGSNDSTFEILTDIGRSDPKVRVIRLRRNYGQTQAMSAGFDFSRGEIIVTMDGDLQNDPRDIPRLLKKLEEGYDIVSGWRFRRQDKFFTRRLPSLIANKLISFFSGVKLHDYGCSLKAYRASILKSLYLYSEMHRFIPALAALSGANTAEIIVNHYPRRYGKSKYGLSRIWKVLADLVTIQMLIKFSSRPAHWFGLVCIPFGFISALFGMWAMYLYAHYTKGGFPIIIPSVCILFFFLSFYFLSLGFFSELTLKTGTFSAKSLSSIKKLELL